MILGLISSALAVLKEIPQTSAIASEIAAFEAALTDVLAAAEKAHVEAQASVDPTALQPIDPQP